MLACPDARPAERHDVSCKMPSLDPHAVTVDRDARQPCYTLGVNACGGALTGPAGSYVLLCRDTEGSFSGPVRVVAPDGSVVIEGDCDHSAPVGAWFRWAGGHLEGAAGYERGQQRGVVIEVDLHSGRVSSRYVEKL